MQNSDLKELLEDVTLNEIHLSNEERQEMTSTFSQIIKKKKRKVQKKRIWSAVAICACVVVVVLGWYSMGQLTVFSAEKKEYWLNFQITLLHVSIGIPHFTIIVGDSVFQRSEVKGRGIF